MAPWCVQTRYNSFIEWFCLGVEFSLVLKSLFDFTTYTLCILSIRICVFYRKPSWGGKVFRPESRISELLTSCSSSFPFSLIKIFLSYVLFKDYHYCIGWHSHLSSFLVYTCRQFDPSLTVFGSSPIHFKL